MPDALDAHRHVEAMDLPSLYARYEELKASLKYLPDGRPDPNATEDDTALQEMCVILMNLRKRSAGPPKQRKSGGPTTRRIGTPIIETSLDDL